MIPDAAIEAAAEAIHDRCDGECFHSPLGTVKTCERDARAAIEAAMPAIREALAQEIEAVGRAEVQWQAEAAMGHPRSVEMGRVIGSEDAYKDALRIVRGGT